MELSGKRYIRRQSNPHILFQRGAMAAQTAVNRWVGGSNPPAGARVINAEQRFAVGDYQTRNLAPSGKTQVGNCSKLLG